MATDDTDTTAEQDEQDSEDETVEFYVEELRVHGSGMVTIPHRLREGYGIEAYDVVDIIVYGGDMPFQATDIVVMGDERIRIPDRKRTLYGIEDGDAIDVEMATTGLTFPEGEL